MAKRRCRCDARPSGTDPVCCLLQTRSRQQESGWRQGEKMEKGNEKGDCPIPYRFVHSTYTSLPGLRKEERRTWRTVLGLHLLLLVIPGTSNSPLPRREAQGSELSRDQIALFVERGVMKDFSHLLLDVSAACISCVYPPPLTLLLLFKSLRGRKC
jgi:hypothetical protein